jgi:UDP-xylose/UDP-N-acetylglucosamine transporter B4
MSQHVLSLPIFLFFAKDIRQGFGHLSSPSTSHSLYPKSRLLGLDLDIEEWKEYMVLAANLVTQLMCVSGVNRMSSVCSSRQLLSLISS